ncbi:MAG TPA: amino acid ABC transporter ATP-binding protein [Firmicutes bacterium]|nr:amino acid ABC transporter ATP-binding protein [Bacillota bacterium]
MEFVLSGVDVIKGQKILDNIDLEIEKGSIFVLIGPSGSGKSSLLRLLNRLDEPSSGEIFYNKKPLESFPVQKLRTEVGMLFQQPVMIKGTVKDNLALGLQLQKKDLSNEEALELLDTVGLDRDILNKDAEILSGGQKQRVALARVLANNPKVLLLDEPTSALDPGAILQVKETLLKLNKEGLTLVWVTHDMGLAQEVATNGALLVKGKIVENGPREELFNSQNQLTQSFLKGELK